MKVLVAKFAVLGAFLLAGVGAVSGASAPRILAMGDSLMASHSISGRAIPDVVGKILDEPVVDRSFMGARMVYILPISGSLGMSIPKQFRPGNWDWVIVNGGGNDLWFGCGCNHCNAKMSRLISGNGDYGVIPRLVARLRQTGARVIYVGYLRSPGVGSLIEHCRDEGDELENRISHMAEQDDGVYFLSLKELVPYGDRSYHAVDMIHPSAKGSRAIGRMISEIIKQQ